MIRLLMELVREWTGSPDASNASNSRQSQSCRKSPDWQYAILNFWLPERNFPGFALAGSLVMCFVILVATGFGLWFFYSPSVTSAWESVYFIENRVPLGHWIRGLHYLTSDVMIVVAILYIINQVVSRMYTRFYGIWFYICLGLFGMVMFSSLVGLLLPWDQQGYWSTRIRLDITSSLPVAGPIMAKLLSGSDPLGHLSLTRSSVFHMGLVPPAIVLFLSLLAGLHVLERRQSASTPPKREEIKKRLNSTLIHVGVVMVVTVVAIVGSGFIHLLLGGEDAWGAPHLKAPADPASNYPIARPEWYFLWLFQMLKYFPGDAMIIGTAVIPGLLTGFILLMPHVARWRWGHRANKAAGLIVLFVISGLTLKAFLTDFWDEEYNKNRLQAMDEGKRTVLLASEGIPPTGALSLMESDALTQGRKLFAAHCASCHRYNGHDGTGNVPEDEQSAPDLFAFASVPWIEKLLTSEHYNSEAFFGGTRFKGRKMSEFIADDLTDLDEDGKAALADVILMLSSQARLPYQPDIHPDSENPEVLTRIEAGEEHLIDTFGCVDCHMFEIPDEDATAPDLTGYGSKEWISRFINDPGHPALYGSRNDRMPAFGKEALLSPREIHLITDWIRHDWKFAESPDITSSFLNQTSK